MTHGNCFVSQFDGSPLGQDQSKVGFLQDSNGYLMPNFSINRHDAGGSPKVSNHGTNLDNAHFQPPMSQRNTDRNRVDFKDEVDSEVSLTDSSFNN